LKKGLFILSLLQIILYVMLFATIIVQKGTITTTMFILFVVFAELTTCLEGVHIPEVKLPEGFTPEESQMVVKGVCKECQ